MLGQGKCLSFKMMPIIWARNLIFVQNATNMVGWGNYFWSKYCLFAWTRKMFFVPSPVYLLGLRNWFCSKCYLFVWGENNFRLQSCLFSWARNRFLFNLLLSWATEMIFVQNTAYLIRVANSFSFEILPIYLG